MDMAESTGTSQPEPCNTQPSPVKSSQVVSGQSSEMPTLEQTVMASAFCSTHETACTQNSTENTGKGIDFHFGEPCETASVNQQVVSAEQKKSPSGSQHMNLNCTYKNYHLHPQKTAVLDTRENLYNEDYWMRTLSPDKTHLIQNIAMWKSQSITCGNHQIDVSGSQADQDSNVDQFKCASVCNQTFKEYLEKAFNGDQTSYYSQTRTRNRGHPTDYRSQMTALSCSRALHSNQIITSFSEQNLLGDSQWNLVAHNRSYQMTSFSCQNVCNSQENLLSGEPSLSGYQTSGYRCDQDLIGNHEVTSPIDGQPLYDFQIPTTSFDTTLHGTTRTTSSAEDNLAWHSEISSSSEESFYLGQIKTSVDQNVYPSQCGTPNIEESLEHQVTSFSNKAPHVGESAYHSSSPLIQRQAQENSLASRLVQGQHPEMNLDLKTQSLVSLKTTHPLKCYSCTYQDCNKSYKRAHGLKNHMKKHTGEKPYACSKPGCKWKFFTSGELKRHKQKHSDVRHYPCPMCNKSFSRLEYLKQHVRCHIPASLTTTT
ncbi:Kruppel-like factor 18 [Grammomys surdaster]|uniref:Kruppel-like factor 18 n=1 Tax=Grammomys surdaster TaxID=491861 RepID=UPI00109FA915|nr:Kruppel-like factor 18 [Grammomys surdaster]